MFLIRFGSEISSFQIVYYETNNIDGASITQVIYCNQGLAVSCHDYLIIIFYRFRFYILKITECQLIVFLDIRNIMVVNW